MKKVLFLSFLFATCCMFAATTKVQADMAKIADHVNKRSKEPWTWVFYGDSITHGAAHTYGWRSFSEIFHERVRWEYRLKNDTVINSGMSGDTTFGLLDNAGYQRRVKRYSPQVVFLLIGINDIMRSNCNGSGGFRDRLEKLVRKLQADGVIVVMQTYNTINIRPEWNEKHFYVQCFRQLPAFNDVIRETAAKYSAVLVDHDKHWRVNAADTKVLKSWLGEYIHPGAKGHLEMANLILKTLNMYDAKSRCSNAKACNPF
jgi:lysophospholipase L1-like esterase